MVDDCGQQDSRQRTAVNQKNKQTFYLDSVGEVSNLAALERLINFKVYHSCQPSAISKSRAYNSLLHKKCQV